MWNCPHPTPASCPWPAGARVVITETGLRKVTSVSSGVQGFSRTHVLFCAKEAVLKNVCLCVDFPQQCTQPFEFRGHPPKCQMGGGGNFPGSPVVKTSPSEAGGEGSIPGLPGRGAKIPHASGARKPKT